MKNHPKTPASFFYRKVTGKDMLYWRSLAGMKLIDKLIDNKKLLEDETFMELTYTFLLQFNIMSLNHEYWEQYWDEDPDQSAAVVLVECMHERGSLDTMFNAYNQSLANFSRKMQDMSYDEIDDNNKFMADAMPLRSRSLYKQNVSSLVRAYRRDPDNSIIKLLILVTTITINLMESK